MSYSDILNEWYLFDIITVITNLLFLAGLVMSTVLIYKKRKKAVCIITPVLMFITFICNPLIKTAVLYLKHGKEHVSEEAYYTYSDFFWGRFNSSAVLYLVLFVLYGFVLYYAGRYSKKYVGGEIK